MPMFCRWSPEWTLFNVFTCCRFVEQRECVFSTRRKRTLLSRFLSIWRIRTSFSELFNFYVFSAVRKNKDGIWQCLLVATPVIFERYIQAVKERCPSPDARTVDTLCFNAEYLLLQFNSNQREIRRCADTCLTRLADAFPFLLWNGRVIFSALSLIQALARNIEEDVDCRVQTLVVPRLPWQIQLQVRILVFI